MCQGLLYFLLHPHPSPAHPPTAPIMAMPPLALAHPTFRRLGSTRSVHTPQPHTPALQAHPLAHPPTPDFSRPLPPSITDNHPFHPHTPFWAHPPPIIRFFLLLICFTTHPVRLPFRLISAAAQVAAAPLARRTPSPSRLVSHPPMKARPQVELFP